MEGRGILLQLLECVQELLRSMDSDAGVDESQYRRTVQTLDEKIAELKGAVEAE